jgi:hypothetical protein
MLAVNQYRLGAVALAAGDRPAARRYFADALSRLEALAGEAPGDASIAMRLADTLTASAGLAAQDGHAAEASRKRDLAETLFREHAGAEAAPSYQASYAQLLLSVGRVAEARPIVERLRAIGYRPRRLEGACLAAGL